MFRNLCMLRKNILLSRIIYSSYTLRANVISSKLQSKTMTTESRGNGISVTDIDVCDLAKGDVEFTRNFLTTFSTISPVNIAFNPEPAVESDAIAEPLSSDSGGCGIGGSSTSILDKDGMPIVPIEIDGWNHPDDEDEEGPTVQNNSQHIEIGNDNEYKAENLLVVPEKREGHFEYKGIKVKLPESAHKDIGTYRFRRDQEDLETVADDMRVVKFDKK
ncbi:uncharacterized protein [Drosophila virilis]|uniref:Uncharacterized protein n=1 Tax=Drosophila virilis TaxID=7244 RepID=B4LVA3_DROVI|nr:uncharacterized protein LOC6628199 [Drosophila virilis]EDW64363.1 uncharacterized protein Dvir_GJ17432 [Drosophila virilis]